MLITRRKKEAFCKLNVIRQVFKIILEVFFLYAVNFLVIDLDNFSSYAYEFELESIWLFIKQPNKDVLFDVTLLLLAIVFKLFFVGLIFCRQQYALKTAVITIITVIYILLYLNLDGLIMIVRKGGIVLIAVSYLCLLSYLITMLVMNKRTNM